MDNLTSQEIDVLIDALDAWVQKGESGQIMSSMMGALICGDDEEAKLKMDDKLEVDREKYNQDKKNRKERATVLQAKLIQMRDSEHASTILNEAISE